MLQTCELIQDVNGESDSRYILRLVDQALERGDEDAATHLISLLYDFYDRTLAPETLPLNLRTMEFA